MKKIKTPQVKTVLLTSKAKKLKDHQSPVYISVFYNGKRKYYSLSMSGRPKQWDIKKGRYLRNPEGNKEIKKMERKAENAISELDRLRIEFTHQKFEEFFLHGRASKGTVLEIFDQLVEEKTLAGRIGTANSYRDTRNAVACFLKDTKRSKDLSFLDVDYSFLKKFEGYLLSDAERSYKRPGKPVTAFSKTSVAIYMRNLRAAYNRAIKQGQAFRDKYPFTKDAYKIEAEPTMKRALSEQEIAKLLEQQHKIEDASMHESFLLWLFIFYSGGMNLADMARLRWDQHIFEDRIRFLRQKTIKTRKDPTPIIILRNPAIDNLLQWFADQPTPYDTGYVFPILNREDLTENQIKNRYKKRLNKLNQDVQKIAAEAGISKPDEVGSYTARHSFSAIYYRKHKDIYALSKRLGHSTVSMTEKYLRSLGIEDLEATGDKISEALPLTIMKVS